MYRVCQVQGEAYGVVYQECSTENGASGAGVYMQVYDLEINDWDRVVSINWCDSLAGRKRNSASEASQAWPGGEKGLFSSPRPCSAFHSAPLGSLFASYWCKCKLFVFSVLVFSLLLIACWNTEHQVQQEIDWETAIGDAVAHGKCSQDPVLLDFKESLQFVQQSLITLFLQSCYQPTLLETLGPVGLRRMGEKSPPFIILWGFLVQDASLECIIVITRETIAQNMLSSRNFVLLSFLFILCSNIRYFIYTSHDNL